ncbi:hypothetical protein [Aeromicrobium sp. UC242_57]|uniref:hypothetical protein n=1 Tax=Aeromicrobium sp. UC242_57 TaxID=3374624 RepID=UPI0037B0B735
MNKIILEDQREDSPRLSAAQETWYSLSGLREHIRGTAGLANERVRLAAVEADDRQTGREPEGSRPMRAGPRSSTASSARPLRQRRQLSNRSSSNATRPKRPTRPRSVALPASYGRQPISVKGWLVCTVRSTP